MARRVGAAGLLVALLACSGGDNGAKTGTSSQAICIGSGCTGSGGGSSGTPATLGWPSTPPPSAGNDSRLQGTGNVGADAQYHYSIPLDLPRGRQGMAPTLAISYSSTAPDGYLGVGWGLDGLSGIAPCPQTWATNGRAVPVKMDGTDALCLDGQQLLDISGGAGTQFATERDNFARITKVPVSSLDPALVAADGLGAQNGSATPAFVVQAPGGETLVYKDYDPVGAPQSHWLLDRATDLDGNSVAYTYWDQSQVRIPGLVANVFRSEYPIASIVYTGRVHPGSVTAGERTIVFNYDQGYAGRLDGSGHRYGGIPSSPCTTSSSGTPTCATVSGAEETISHLLTSIDVYAPAPGNGTATTQAKAYSYEFGFTQSPSTQRMLLTSVEKVAGDYNASIGYGGRTLARQFQYNDASSGLSWNTDWTEVPLNAVGQPPYVDIDNDGLADMFNESGGAVTVLTGATVADGGLTVTVNGSPTLGIDISSASFADLDGDGVPEILAHASNRDESPYLVYHRSGGAYATSSLPPLPGGAQLVPDGNTNQLVPVDLDGRGLPSLVVLSSAPVEPQSTQTYISGGYLFPNQAGVLGAPANLFAGQTGSIVNPTADPTAQAMSGALTGDSPFTGLWPIQYPGLPLSIDYPFPVLQTLFVQDGAGVGAFAALSASPASGTPVALPVLLGGPASTLWAISSKSVYGPLDTPSPLDVLRWTSAGRPLTLVSGTPALGAAASCTYGSESYSEGGGQALVGNFDGRSPMEIFQLNPCVHLQGVVSPNLPWDDGTGPPNDNDPRPAFWSLMQADVDGDGRDDVIALHVLVDTLNGNEVDAAYLVRWSPAGVLLPAVKMPFVPTAFADFDGDGIPDFKAITLPGGAAPPTGGGIYLHKHVAHDLLTDVLDEGAPAPLEIVSYTRDWGKTGTAPVSGFLENKPTSALWPVHDIPSGMQVVAARSIYQGADVGQYDLHQYTYSGPRSDMLGRGFLGFSSIVDFEPTRPAETLTTYDNSTIHLDNAYLAFTPQTVTTTVPTVPTDQGATLAMVRQTVTTYQNTLVPTRANTYVPQLAGWTSTEVETPAAINWSAQILPSHFTIGSATPLRYRAAAFQYDTYGNVTSGVEATSSSKLTVSGGAVSGTVTGVESITTTTPAAYLTSPTQWLVTRPAHVSAVVWTPSTQSQASVTPRTEDFVYDPAHPALVQTEKTNTAASDPTVPLWTTYWRSADGVVTATTLEAYDPVRPGYHASTGAALSLLGTTPCPWAGGLPCATRTTSMTLDPDEGIFPRQITLAYNTPQALTSQVLVNPTFGVAVDSIDPNGVATQVVLDDLGRARQVTAGPNPTVYIDFAQRLSANGTQVVGTTATTHGLGVVTSTVMLDLLGRAVGTQTVAFDGNLDCAFSSYDVLGRKTFDSRPVESSTACIPFTNVGTTYQYDPMDRLLSEQLSDGSSNSYVPTFLSNTTTDPMGHVRVVTHDLDGRTTQSTQYLVSGNTSAPLTTSYSYGAFNQLTQTRDPKGNANTVTYDAAGRRASQFDPDSGGTQDVYNGFGELAIESRTGVPCALSGGLDYCVVSLTASAQNPQPGNIVTLTATVSLNIQNSPYYLVIADEAGNVVCSAPSLYTCSTTVTSATAASHTYSAYLTYGGAVTNAAATSTGTVTVQWGAPAGPTPPVAGLLSTAFTHDTFGRVAQRYNTEDGTSSFVFDVSAKGLPTSATSPDQVTTTFGYDSASRPTTTTWTTPTGPGSAMESFTTTTGYDPYGRAALFTYPSVPGSFSTQRNYDPGTFSFVSVTTPTTSISATAPIWAVQSRWPDGQLHTGQLGNGLVESRTYDAVGRLLTATDTLSGASSPARSLTYVYNADGLATSRTDNVRRHTESFAYDSLHRITGWGLSYGGFFPGGQSLSYGYDTGGLGNITSITGSSWVGLLGTTTLPAESDAYASWRPHALTSTTAGTTTGNYTWDERGRMTSSPTVQGAAYDARDLPRSVTTSAGTTTFLYDAYGARVYKANGSKGTATLTLGRSFERRTVGTAVTDVFYVPGSDGQLAQVEWQVGGSSYVVQYIHADSLGSSSVVTNALGQVESYLDYDPFGKRVTSTGAAETSFTDGAGTSGDITIGFADLFQDDDLGLVNMNGRMYDPVARHFISADPLVSYPLNSQGFNRYSYVMNDPVNMTDPSGDGSDAGGGSDDSAGDDFGSLGGNDGSTPTPPGGHEGPVGPIYLTTPSTGSAAPSGYGLAPTPLSGVTYSAPAASPNGFNLLPQGCSGGGNWCFGRDYVPGTGRFCDWCQALLEEYGLGGTPARAGPSFFGFKPERPWYLAPSSWSDGFWSMSADSGSSILTRGLLYMSAGATIAAGGFVLLPEMGIGGTTLGAIGATPVTAGGLGAGVGFGSASTLARTSATAAGTGAGALAQVEEETSGVSSQVPSLKDIMEDFPYKPAQNSVDPSKVFDKMDAMLAGQVPSPVTVNGDGFLIDGHHRAVAYNILKYFGMLPDGMRLNIIVNPNGLATTTTMTWANFGAYNYMDVPPPMGLLFAGPYPIMVGGVIVDGF